MKSVIKLMKSTLKVILLVVALPLFWASTLLLVLACVICPSLYPAVVKNFKNLGEHK